MPRHSRASQARRCRPAGSASRTRGSRRSADRQGDAGALRSRRCRLPTAVHSPEALTSFRWTWATRSSIVSRPPSPLNEAGSSIAALPGSQIRRRLSESAAASAALASSLVATLHSCSFSSASVTPASLARAAARRNAAAELGRARRSDRARASRRTLARRAQTGPTQPRAHVRGHGPAQSGSSPRSHFRNGEAIAQTWKPRASSSARIECSAAGVWSTIWIPSTVRSSTARIPSSVTDVECHPEARVDLVRDHAQLHARASIRPDRLSGTWRPRCRSSSVWRIRSPS